MKDIGYFITGLRRFQQQYFDPNEQWFAPLQQGQKPNVLLIGCSDSRVDPPMLTEFAPGELLVMRSVANMVPPCRHDSYHHGVSTAFEYAVCHLEVEHIIVLGHSGCAGIRALINGVSNGLPVEFIGPWMNIDKRARKQLLKELSDKEPPMQIRACEQAAILVSVENLRSFPSINERVKSGNLLLHGWYFDISIGQLLSYSHDTGCFDPLG